MAKTYSDYPKAASNNAQKALDHRDSAGSDCGTQVGWERANQLASREPLSLETVTRTYSFLSRAKTYDQGDFTDGDGNEICGSVMYAAWGGDPMLRWSERIVENERQLVQKRHIVAISETEESYVIEYAKPATEMATENSRQATESFATGDYVSWRSGDSRARGRITQVRDDGVLAADSGFEITGTEDNPAAKIAIYEPDGDVYVKREPEQLVVHYFSELTKEDSDQFRSSQLYTYMEQRNKKGPDSVAGVQPERRTYNSNVEVRMKGDDKDKKPVISGYALRFNKESEDLGGFTEVIAPGALDNTDMEDVRALFNHDPNFVLGRTSSGTLKLEIDENGLRYEITPSDSQLVRDLVYEPIRRGDITQSSFGFTVMEEDSMWEERTDGPWKRTITNIRELFDVSPVTFPAYRQTEATARSFESAKSENTELAEQQERQKRMDEKYMETFKR